MKKIAIITASVLIILSLGVSIFIYASQPKVAYLKVQKLYNDFEYKIELENKYDEVVNTRKRILDSLEIQINALATNIQNSEVNKEKNIQNYQYLVSQYQNNKKNFGEDNEIARQKYTEQIWTQLNKYIEEYGKTHNYDFVYGADGSGGVMHADKKYDITEQMTVFANMRYQGGGLNVR